MKRKNRDTPGSRIAQAIIAEYKPKSVAEMQSALKWKVILATNRRNGYFNKTLKTSMGDTTITMPRDRHAFFESIILPKHKRDECWRCMLAA